jgi:hypothetical protein
VYESIPSPITGETGRVPERSQAGHDRDLAFMHLQQSNADKTIEEFIEEDEVIYIQMPSKNMLIKP